MHLGMLHLEAAQAGMALVEGTLSIQNGVISRVQPQLTRKTHMVFSASSQPKRPKRIRNSTVPR